MLYIMVYGGPNSPCHLYGDCVRRTPKGDDLFMRAVIITRPGGPEVLDIQNIALPEPVGDQVRVRVRAAGLNRADLSQRAGYYPAPPGSPANIPGLEFAGEVDAVGPLVRIWKPGQRVMGITGGGGQAEYVLSHEGMLVEIPDSLDFVQAAAVPEVFMTAHDALFTQAGLQMGERVLIHAVGSGVGTAALQLAHTVGATVFGTSRTPQKLEQAKALGLDVALSEQNFAAQVKQRTNREGVHVVLDFVGAAYMDQNSGVPGYLGTSRLPGYAGWRTCQCQSRGGDGQAHPDPRLHTALAHLRRKIGCNTPLRCTGGSPISK